MSDIVKAPPLAPVQLATGIKTKLKHNQQVLMDLILDHTANRKVITMDDIILAYRKTETWASKYDEISVYGYEQVNGEWKYGCYRYPWNHPKSRSTMEFRAMCWFRQNLGSCIVAGRLVAIPVIDIE